jgi:hypothetical protein
LRDSTSWNQHQDHRVRPGRIAFDRLGGGQFDGFDLIADQGAPLQQPV